MGPYLAFPYTGVPEGCEPKVFYTDCERVLSKLSLLPSIRLLPWVTDIRLLPWVTDITERHSPTNPQSILSKLSAAKELMAEVMAREKKKQAEREAEKAAKAEKAAETSKAAEGTA